MHQLFKCILILLITVFSAISFAGTKPVTVQDAWVRANRSRAKSWRSLYDALLRRKYHTRCCRC